jgi:hypothetical protein
MSRRMLLLCFRCGEKDTRPKRSVLRRWAETIRLALSGPQFPDRTVVAGRVGTRGHRELECNAACYAIVKRDVF